MTSIRSISRAALMLAGIVAVTAFALPSRAPNAPHVRLTKSVPMRNDTLAAAPKTLQLWFAEAVDLKTTHVSLANAAGAKVELSAITRESMAGMDDKDMPVVAAIAKPIGSGNYTISWDAIAADGEASKGNLKFVVK